MFQWGISGLLTAIWKETSSLAQPSQVGLPEAEVVLKLPMGPGPLEKVGTEPMQSRTSMAVSPAHCPLQGVNHGIVAT